MGPASTTWSDLGNHVTLQARVGTSHGMKTNDIEFDYHTALIWSLTSDQGHTSDDHTDHVAPGLTSLIAEFGGRTVDDGPNETRTTNEVLFGISYALDGRWEMRGGYQFPVGGPQDNDRRFVAGAIYHF